MRSTRKSSMPQFSLLLREQGWLLKTAPMPMLAGMGIDDEYVYVKRADQLVHLHISAGAVEWAARRYTREPFGDYTTVFQAMGSGKGLDSLKTFVEAQK